MKSALLKRFIHDLYRPQYHPVYLHLTHLPAGGLLKLIVVSLGEMPRRAKDRLFEQILDKARRLDGALLLIRDEAHPNWREGQVIDIALVQLAKLGKCEWLADHNRAPF